MEEKRNLIAEYKAARERGDEEAMRDVMRRMNEWSKTHPEKEPPRRADVARDLRRACEQGSPSDAERVVLDALKQREAHLLHPDDLVWVVAKVGAWESSWRAGQAVAAWLYHHGPSHRALVATAEDIASYDNAEWLDEVLLWIEPTPQRWFEHACWVSALLGCELCHRMTCGGLDVRARDDLFVKYAVEYYAEHAKRVLAERGDAARRSLRAAPELTEAEDVAPGVRRVLDAWVEAFT